MKLGIFDHMQKNDKPERSYADMYANHLEIVEFADQAGIDFYFVAEHHFDLGFSECPSPGTFLGAASQRTRTIRLGPLVYVLPKKSRCSTISPRAAWSVGSAPGSALLPLPPTASPGMRSEKWRGRRCG